MRAYIIASSRAAVDKSSSVGSTLPVMKLKLFLDAPSFVVGRTLPNEAYSQKTQTSFAIPSLLVNGLHTLKSLRMSCFQITRFHVTFAVLIGGTFTY